MHTIHRSRTAVSSLVAVLLLTLAAPIAVHGQDEDLAEEPVLAAQDQDPALVPVAPVTITAQVPADVRWAPSPASAPEPEEALRAVVAAALAWDESSGYGAVEASRTAIGHEDGVSGYTPTGHEAEAAIGPSWDDTSGYGGQDKYLAFAAAAAKSWDVTSGYGSVEASRAVPDAIVTP